MSGHACCSVRRVVSWNHNDDLARSPATQVLTIVRNQILVLCFLGVVCCDDDDDDLCSDGLCIDLTSYNEQVQAIYGGVFSGTVAEGGTLTDEGIEPCSIVGEPFSISLTVDDVRSCQDDIGDWDTGFFDCAEAMEGYFPAEGTLIYGDGEANTILADITALSREDGLWLFSEMWVSPESAVGETFSAQPVSGYADGLVITGFRSERRISEPQADEAVWQICDLTVEVHEP